MDGCAEIASHVSRVQADIFSKYEIFPSHVGCHVRRQALALWLRRVTNHVEHGSTDCLGWLGDRGWAHGSPIQRSNRGPMGVCVWTGGGAKMENDMTRNGVEWSGMK